MSNEIARIHSMTTGERNGIPEDFEDLSFVMDPNSDDLIRGNELREGMVVLIEGLTAREDPIGHFLGSNHECEKYRCSRIEETTRWCQVTKLRRTGDIISFIGLYSDGTKRSRTYNISYCWFVKKRSLNG